MQRPRSKAVYSDLFIPDQMMVAVDKPCSLPRLVSTGVAKQLVVRDQPFLIRGAELQNSSMTSAEYMETVWQGLVDTHINTVLGCVTWEAIEPIEGQFDFTNLDAVIMGARRHGLHLVLLWFGSFKNGKSTYVPTWVKTDAKRFPRARLRQAGGVLEVTEVLSLFHREGCEADSKAFAKLMAHLKEIDEAHSTVIMVQVENEVGLLGDSRDGCEAANKVYGQSVPQDLLDYLEKDWDALHPDLKTSLSIFRSRRHQVTTGSWEEVFGKSLQTEEIFMAYHYALYLEEVASAGKTAYSLPLYTNVWLNYGEDDKGSASDGASSAVVAAGGGNPGHYPSGGATSNVLDIWQRYAPSLDFIAPDIYLNDYETTCSRYRHRNQPLFVAEQRRDAFGARRIWLAYGSYAALGACPFGIDTTSTAERGEIAKHYTLIYSVSSIILEAQRRPGALLGICFDEPPALPGAVDKYKPVIHRWGDFELTIERAFVFGRPGPAAGMIVYRGGAEFLLIGWGFQVTARSTSPTSTFTGILRFEENTVRDQQTGELRTLRQLNGDETRSGEAAVMPNEDPDYGGFPICVTIPARTSIATLELYSLEADPVEVK